MVSPINQLNQLNSNFPSSYHSAPALYRPVLFYSLQHQELFIACPDSSKTRAVLYCLLPEMRAPHRRHPRACGKRQDMGYQSS